MAATIRPLQRPVPLRQSVYDALIDLIIGGELPRGSTWWRPTWPASWG